LTRSFKRSHSVSAIFGNAKRRSRVSADSSLIRTAVCLLLTLINMSATISSRLLKSLIFRNPLETQTGNSFTLSARFSYRSNQLSWRPSGRFKKHQRQKHLYIAAVRKASLCHIDVYVLSQHHFLLLLSDVFVARIDSRLLWFCQPISYVTVSSYITVSSDIACTATGSYLIISAYSCDYLTAEMNQVWSLCLILLCSRVWQLFVWVRDDIW